MIKKIGIISFHTFSQPGGVKKHILGLFKEFKKRGIETKIIVPRRKKSEKYKSKNIILMGTSFPINFNGSQSDFNINFNPVSLEKTLRKEKFDVLHFHNFGFPSILQILFSPSASNTLNILTFHANLMGNPFVKKFPTLIPTINKICQWKINGVIGVAPLVLDYFQDFNGLKKIIPNGIDLEEFNPSVPEIKKFKDGKINILFVGRIEERKGLIYLLKAYKKLEKKYSNLRLIVIGDGPLKENCESYIKDNNLKNVVFEGQITKNTASYYKTADIYVSPAIFGESFGIVLLEAMACGTPLVAFDNQGYNDLLKETYSEKFLAKNKDYNDLANKIESLIKNPTLREEAGRKGLKDVQKYSWKTIASKVLKFYEECEKIRDS